MTSASHESPNTSRRINAKDIEPDDVWKANLRREIEESMQPMWDDAKRKHEQELALATQRLEAQYKVVMKDLRILAETQFREGLLREREERRWAANLKINPEWLGAMEEKQKLADTQIKQRSSISESPTEGGRTSAPAPAPPPMPQLPPPTSASDYAARAARRAAAAPPPPPQPSQAPAEPDPTSSSEFAAQAARCAAAAPPPPPQPSRPAEPDEVWKANLRREIEESMQPMWDDAKRKYEQDLDLATEPSDMQRLEAQYKVVMKDLRILAETQFRERLLREKQERRWAANMEINPEWLIAMEEEQRLLHAQMKQQSSISESPTEGGRTSAPIPAPPPTHQLPPSTSSSEFAAQAARRVAAAPPPPPQPSQAPAEPDPTSPSEFAAQDARRAAAAPPPPPRPSRTPAEPDEVWKANLRREIEERMLPMWEDAKRKHEQDLVLAKPSDMQRLEVLYKFDMKHLRILAEDEFQQRLLRETLDRRQWAAKMEFNAEWLGAMADK